MARPFLTGVLKTWKEDRGFGFISPSQGGRDVFIHISAIAPISRRPVPGDVIHYQVTRDRSGKYKAINASIEGIGLTGEQATSKSSRKGGLWILALLFGLAGALLAYLYVGGYF